MAKREYIKLICCIFCCYGIWHCQNTLASAHVPGKGRYKIDISGQISDGATRSFIRRKEKRHNYIAKQIDILDSEEEGINKVSTSENANNPGSVADTGISKAIMESEKSALKQEIELFKQYTDLHFGSSTIEYGFGGGKSFGASFSGQKQGISTEAKNLYSGAAFFKKQIYNKKSRGKRMIITAQAKLLFDRHNISSKTFGEISMYFAFPRRIKIRDFKSKDKKQKKDIGEMIVEYGIYSGFPLDSDYDKDGSYFAVSLSKVIKNKSGWFLSQYQRISRCNTDKQAYRNTFYTKTSIGKEIIFQDNASLTLEIGYFKNKSQNYERIQITGVCFSIRMEG